MRLSGVMQRRVSAIAVMAALALASGLAGCGSQHSNATVQVGTQQVGSKQLRSSGPRLAGLGDAFAGVLWAGKLASIGGDWQVPAIQPGSQPGRAATWIGAQGFGKLDPSPGSQSAPFIQIGTQEELHRVAGPGARGELVDEAFWTDVVRGLHPVALFRVRPGDTVAATMRLADQRWTLTITDRTTGHSQRVETGQEGTGAFSVGLWLQEDPTDALTNRVFPYPDLGPVHISGLSVDATRPAAARLKTTWMALPHAYVAPTAPAGDAFSVAARALSSGGARFLKIAGPADAQVGHFLEQAATWRADTPRAVIHAAIRRLISALSLEVTRLRAHGWPAGVAAPISRVADPDATQAAALDRALSRGPAAVLAALPHGRGGAAQAVLMERIRRGLGLPLFSY